jgi:hypothetical protein
MENIPYAVYESSQVRHERTVKRLIAVIIFLIVMLFASHMAWLYAWQSYDYESTETIVSQDTQEGGNANYIGNDGDIVNDEASSGYKETDTP